MIDQKKFHECLHNAGIKFITGVPDSLLNDFCVYVNEELPPERHIIAANEGNAIALASGYHLATGSVPLVYMQNSGLGNAINPLLSLTNKEVYSIPMVLLIGWRGAPGVKDHSHHQKQGELTPVLLESMNIPYKVIEGDGQKAFDAARWAVSTAKEISTPVALVASKGVFERGKKKEEPDLEDSKYHMSRENAIECILDNVPPDTIFVVTTGRATRELFDLRRIKNLGHENDFLNVGAMGHASQIALGIALAKPERLVICLDGDGAATMHLGGLTTVGKLRPKNFLHVVLNNGVHESVGCQPTACFTISLTGIAKNSGYKTIGNEIEAKNELCEAVKKLIESEGPAFVDIRIGKGIRSDLGPMNENLRNLKASFMKQQTKEA